MINTPEQTFKVLSRHSFIHVAKILEAEGHMGKRWEDPTLQAAIIAHKWPLDEFRAANNKYLNGEWRY
jgi:hypothetical protein